MVLNFSDLSISLNIEHKHLFKLECFLFTSVFAWLLYCILKIRLKLAIYNFNSHFRHYYSYLREQTTHWLLDPCLEVLTVHGTELRLFWAKAFPTFTLLMSDLSIVLLQLGPRIELITSPTPSRCTARYATDVGFILDYNASLKSGCFWHIIATTITIFCFELFLKKNLI